MSQDNLIILECEVCSSRRIRTFKNKRKLQQHKLQLKKHCAKCRKHTMHREIKSK